MYESRAKRSASGESMSYIISSMFFNAPALVIGATGASVIILSALEKWGVPIDWAFVKFGLIAGVGITLIKLADKMALFL
jgi:hypothetical protein